MPAKAGASMCGHANEVVPDLVMELVVVKRVMNCHA